MSSISGMVDGRSSDAHRPEGSCSDTLLGCCRWPLSSNDFRSRLLTCFTGKPKPANVYAGYQTPARLANVSKVDPLLAAGIDQKLASTDVDYLANNGAELEKAIKADPVTTQRLEDALTLFTGGLLESKAKIRKQFQES